jgi:hypothetical protein
MLSLLLRSLYTARKPKQDTIHYGYLADSCYSPGNTLLLVGGRGHTLLRASHTKWCAVLDFPYKWSPLRLTKVAGGYFRDSDPMLFAVASLRPTCSLQWCLWAHLHPCRQPGVCYGRCARVTPRLPYKHVCRLQITM